ncbi:DMT family transporter [Sphingopyxis sp.]|uniref:DMT family transporter n=1 Tax=Sphingopyxis sp. TaxID=1908224 RepID=UPI0035B3F643
MNAAIAHPSPNKDLFRGIACGMGAGALWGLVFLAPALVPDFTPIQLAIGRYLAYGFLSATLIGRNRKRLMAAMTPREWVSLIWLSLAGNTLYYILLAAAIQMGGIAMTSLIIGFLPIAVTIIGSRDDNAVPLRKLAPSLMLCTAGAICIGWQALTAPASGSTETQLAGLLCAAGALLSWTAYAVGNSRCLARLDHVSAHDWSLLTGLVTGAQVMTLIPITLLFEPVRHPAPAWLAFAAVSVAVAFLASIAGNALWNRMSRLLPLTLTGQMILLETVFALLYGFLWEHRLPTIMETTAFSLIVLSVTRCIAVHQTYASNERGRVPAQ